MKWFRLPPRPAGVPEAWSLEVQIHPADIRHRVRYLFLSRRQVTLWSIPVLAYMAFLALGLWSAPTVIGGILHRHEYSSLVAERSQQGQRLQELVTRLEQVETRTDGLHLRMNKILLAYALPAGLPADRLSLRRLPVQEAPDSIYAGTIQQGNRLQARIGERLGTLDTQLREVRAYEQANQEQVRSTPSVCPLRDGDFVLTSPFGRRRSPFTKEFELHVGLDLAAPQGMAIRSPADGVVAFAGEYPVSRSVGWWRFGKLVIVKNGDRFVTIFGHCDEVRVRTEDGRWVPADPLIYILDHRWPNEERLLARARSAPEPQGYEPLPPVVEGRKAGR